MARNYMKGNNKIKSFKEIQDGPNIPWRLLELILRRLLETMTLIHKFDYK